LIRLVVKILRSLYPAESGVAVAANQHRHPFGRNQFHGSGFEFVRNERFNANDFLSNKTANGALVGRDDNGNSSASRSGITTGFTIGGPCTCSGLEKAGRRRE
jgi:hypothetical protein